MTQSPAPYLRTDARREMIAEAARQIVLEKGIAGLRTRDVAARVGINISTLHFHVKTKAALVQLVAETSRGAFLALLPPPPDPARDADELLRAEAQAYHDSLRDRPELAACFAQLSQLAGEDPALAQTLESFTRDWGRRYAEILAIGRDQGRFRDDLDPRAGALMITGAFTAFGHRGKGGLEMFWPVFDELARGLRPLRSRGDDR